MKKVIKWFLENDIEIETRDGHTNTEVTVTIEKDCEWVNGLNEVLKYNKGLRVYQDTYKNYYVVETTGYNMTHTLVKTTKATDVINTLEKRFK